MSGPRNAAIKTAAELLKLQLSPFEDDWPKSMPKRLLRRFEEQGERLGDIAARVRYMGNCLAELDRECARKDERIATLERLLGVVLDQYTFCVDTDPNDADIAEARALLEQQ